MKTISNYINEKLIITRNYKRPFKYYPQTKDELQDIIKQRIKEEGNECNLNDIYVGEITDMSSLFTGSQFNGDISNWNVSNVKNMDHMFLWSKFNGNISKWNVRNVKDMYRMFSGAKFNGDISGWNVSKVEDMQNMFFNCPLQNNTPAWYNN